VGGFSVRVLDMWVASFDGEELAAVSRTREAPVRRWCSRGGWGVDADPHQALGVAELEAWGRVIVVSDAAAGIVPPR
jgi:hypothetical protein